MESARIGVIGYRGKLGKALLTFTGTTPVDCDITSPVSIAEALGNEGFDVIINCAAFTNVDQAENNVLKAYNINSFGPQNLAKIHPNLIIQLSTDYVFDGEYGPYSEDDYTAPLGAYGFSKYFGEVGLRSYMDRTLIVRTTILYDKDTGFVPTIIDQLLQNKPVRVPKTLYGNPTYTHHLAQGIMTAIDKELTGVLNISGETRLSRHETAVEIAKYLKLDTKNVFDGPAWGDAKRPLQAGFKLDKAKTLQIPLYTLWEGLEQIYLDKYADKTNLGNTGS